MKIFTFLLAALLIQTTAEAQYSIGFTGGINFYPSAGPDRMMTGKDGSSFDRFAANYNSLNASTLSSDLSHFKMRPSLSLGLNFMTKSYYSEVSYNTMHGHAEAEFNNGNKRVMDFKSKDLDIGMGFGWSNDKFFAYLVGLLTFSMGDKLECYTQYPDGTKSLGSENYLNGVYHASRLSAKPALRLGYKLNRTLWLFLYMDKQREGGNSAAYRDELAGDIITETINTDLEYIGVDWNDYINRPADYVLEEKEMVKSGWSGLQMKVGICINLVNPE
jgi:hypothetical protein